MTITGLLVLSLGLLLLALAIVPEINRRTRGRSKAGILVSFLPPALQYPKFRAYWLGLFSAVTGFQMFRVGQLWLIYEITDSPVFLGYVGVANAIPGMVFNLVGGVFADKLDKRLLVMSTQSLTGSLILLLGVLTMTGSVQAWHILTVAFLAGAVEAFDTPARQAMYPHLIERKVMTSAVAMNSVIWQSTRIIGPAIAGFIIDLVNTSVSFFVAGAGFVVMAVVMFFLKVPNIPTGSKGNPAQDMLDGLRFIKGNSIFAFLMSMSFFNSLFGTSYIMLMPVFAVDILEVGARGQGLLLGIGGLGGGADHLLVWRPAQCPLQRLSDSRGRGDVRASHRRLRPRFPVRRFIFLGDGVDVLHGGQPVHLHDLYSKLPSDAGARQYARQGNGLLRNDVQHHAPQRDAGGRAGVHYHRPLRPHGRRLGCVRLCNRSCVAEPGCPRAWHSTGPSRGVGCGGHPRRQAGTRHCGTLMPSRPVEREAALASNGLR